MFLARTVQDILENIEADTEIIVVFDGQLADPPLPQHDRVTVIYHSESVGQRAGTKEAAKLARSKYIMKVDAHCAFDKGFDRKMLEGMQDDWTMVPVMKNLHAFDWVCKNGHRRYQGQSGQCTECKEPTERDIIWKPRRGVNSTSYCFSPEPKFQYFNSYKKRQSGDIVETMSLQGSCFMMTKEKYFDLNIDDEEFGSWGSQGIEVACKTWLSGGKCMVNKNTWYAHMFRTQGGDFGFPWPCKGKQVRKAKDRARELFIKNKWDRQKYPISWLVERFWPVDHWTEDDLRAIGGTPPASKGILYYTDNKLSIRLAKRCRRQLQKMGLPITSVSLKPMPDFGNNIHYKGTRGQLTMFKQILAGLEAMKEDIVFFCEHDLLYHQSHFTFTPADKETFYYNENFWAYRLNDGYCLHYDAKKLSGLCAYREPLIQHFRERVALVEKEGFSNTIGYEPMTHNRIKWKNTYKCEGWKSEYPNIDIRHDGNLTSSKWSKKDFRNQKFTKGWQEGNKVVDGWGDVSKYLV